MNIRVTRFPAALSLHPDCFEFQQEIEAFFAKSVLSIAEHATLPGKLSMVLRPSMNDSDRAILTKWMKRFIISPVANLTIEEVELLNNMPVDLRHTVNIMTGPTIYTELSPLTNVPTSNVITFSFRSKYENATDQQYLDYMRELRDEGSVKTDRTGTGTVSKFGHQMRFDLNKGLPLLTTKKTHLKSIIHELIWFLNGDTNIKYLNDNGVSIWDEWADANGELGPVYGAQWRNWTDTKILHCSEESKIKALTEQGYKLQGFLDRGRSNDEAVLSKTYDQVSDILELLKKSPDSRRMVISAWNVGELSSMKLMPCHSLFQFYTTELSVDERVAMRDEIVQKEEDEWHKRREEGDWMENEMRSYRYGRSYWHADDAEAHKALDRHADIPRYRLSCQLYQRSHH